jgi:uncharacterized protein YbbC (DUF1343 family)
MQETKPSAGVDHFLEQASRFKALRFGLVTNDAATTSRDQLSRSALLDAKLGLVKLFSPEHGLTAQGVDGIFQKNANDPVTGLPVVSLYGDHLKPTGKAFAGIDAILFDIPDVGCRFYTYLWTMSYILEACNEYHKALIILDRPNPIGGDLKLAEGALLDEKRCSSFIGRWSIPVRHSCTLGELANFFGGTRFPNADLQIITAKNWQRAEPMDAVDGFYKQPSPAITDQETALLYPGIGLMEGINVNEGRGTPFPFKIIGAPWIDSDQLQNAVHLIRMPGLLSTATSYVPTSGIYAGECCNGLKLAVTDHSVYRPVATGLELVKLINFLYPDDCRERLYKSRANPGGERHLDKLTGVYRSFEHIKMNKLSSFTLDTEGWEKTIKGYLLY